MPLNGLVHEARMIRMIILSGKALPAIEPGGPQDPPAFGEPPYGPTNPKGAAGGIHVAQI